MTACLAPSRRPGFWAPSRIAPNHPARLQPGCPLNPRRTPLMVRPSNDSAPLLYSARWCQQQADPAKCYPIRYRERRRSEKCKPKQKDRERVWRTVRDSNPRGGFPPTRFPGVRLRPLGQPSLRNPLAKPERRRKGRHISAIFFCNSASWRRISSMSSSPSPLLPSGAGGAPGQPAVIARKKACC